MLMKLGLVSCLIVLTRTRGLVLVHRVRLGKGGRGGRASVLESSDGDEVCPLPVKNEKLLEEAREALNAETRVYDYLLAGIPIFSPVLAFFTYESVARETRALMDRNVWGTADGNAYEIEILSPTITGVVMPTLAVALATLSATTISTLRERQLNIRQRLNEELCEIELLRTALNVFSDDDFAFKSNSPTLHASRLLRDYVSRLILETQPSETPSSLENRPIVDNELIALTALLHTVRSRNYMCTIAHGHISALTSLRTQRISLLGATYPFSHYLVLTLCAVAIAINYLLESDQEVLRFLDAIQLRILWAILIGVECGLAVLISDLNNLFRGGFCITAVVAQLFPLREAINYDICTRDESLPSSSSPDGRLRDPSYIKTKTHPHSSVADSLSRTEVIPKNSPTSISSDTSLSLLRSSSKELNAQSDKDNAQQLPSE